MIRRFASLLLVATLGLMLSNTEAAAPPRVEDDSENLVYFGDHGPVLVRLHLRIEGRPHRAAWSEAMGAIFGYVDRDKDGVLSPAEIKALPSVNVLTSAFSFGAGKKTAPPKPGKMTRRELEDYYRRAGLASLQLTTGALRNGGYTMAGATPIAPDKINARLFELLDTDGDGQLSREELDAAPMILAKLDVDEDEMLTANELIGKGGRTSSDDEAFALAFAELNNTSDGTSPLHLVAEGQADKLLGQRLLRHYGKKGAKSLDAKALGVSAGLFAQLDRNRDGKLDADELSRFATVAPPDVEISVRLKKTTTTPAAPPVPRKTKVKTASTVEKVFAKFTDLFKLERDDKLPPLRVHPSPRPLPAGVKLTKSGTGLTIELGKTSIAINIGGASQEMFAGLNLKAQYRALFQMADTDGNGYLDKTEANKNPFFRGTFEAMDGNGDGKLFEKEMLTYVDAMQRLRDRVAKSCLTLNLHNEGKSLFDSVDANSDGRLSVREMRRMGLLLEKFDSNKDGKLSRSEVPRQYRATFERGAGSGMGLFGSVGYAMTPSAPAPAAKGPLWFRKMDRNRDGDVSRKEWLGSEEDFKAIDSDGDGLISLAEAEAYDRTKRAKR